MIQNLEISYNAKTDLSAKEGCAVTITTDTKVNGLPVAAIATAGAACVGIIHEPPKGLGYAMGVVVHGLTRGLAGDTIAAGNRLKADTNGALVPVASDKDAYIAIAQEVAAAGDLFDVFVVAGYYAV